MIRMGSSAYGILLVAAASVLWSTAGLFVRLLDLDVWTMVTWRSLFAALSLFLLHWFQNGRCAVQVIRSIRGPGLAAIPISAVSMFAYPAALKLTTVANVLMVYATVPFVAAALAFLWMREKLDRAVLLASGTALVGIAIMVRGATQPHDIAGNALAFLMTVTFAAVLVMVRHDPRIELVPVNAFAALLCGVICWPFMPSGIPDPYHLAVLALFGVTTTAGAYLLFLMGGRYIPSSEAGLIGMLDVILGPIWVGLAFAEWPSQTAMIGGAFVLAAVGWYLARGLPLPRPSMN
jgi:drug/metabolite transporter (DMT)-like permease